MSVFLNGSRDILLKAIFPYRVYCCLTVFNRKNAMNVQLCVGVRHDKSYMPKTNIY